MPLSPKEIAISQLINAIKNENYHNDLLDILPTFLETILNLRYDLLYILDKSIDDAIKRAEEYNKYCNSVKFIIDIHEKTFGQREHHHFTYSEYYDKIVKLVVEKVDILFKTQ
jgi:hypothetical protein